MSEKFMSLEEYESNAISKCEYVNGIPYQIISHDDFDFASHWIPRFDEDYTGEEPYINITLGKPYRLYLDKYDDESIIIDDVKSQSVLYMAHEGDWVVLKGCSRWKKYIKKCYMEEYQKTEAYQEMIKSSMEFIRRNE